MKLVKIEDIRVGQIWQSIQVSSILYIASNYGNDCVECYKYDCGEFIHNTIFQLNFAKLIGFLGITHEIKDNKLVEIPRAEFEVDDVVKTNTDNIQVIDRIVDEYMVHLLGDDYNFFEEKNELEKIGIIGVTHEFVNERLVK